MELRQYFYLFRRWAWLVILGLILGLAGGYVFSTYQTPVYQTATKVMVSSSPNGIASDYVYGDQQLAQTYVQLLTTQPLLDGVSDYIGFPVSSKQITVQQVQSSPIIKITVEDTDPRKASDIANRLVYVLIERNETLQSGQYAASEESLQLQISQLEEQIAKVQNDLDTLSTKSLSEQLALVKVQMEPLQAEATQLQKDIALLTPAWNQERKVKIAEMEARLDQITPLLNLYQQIYTNLIVLGNPGSASVSSDDPLVTRLQSTLELYQQLYVNLMTSKESIRLARLQNTPNVVQIEVAAVPSTPVRPQPLQNTLLAGAVGLMLTAGIVFLIEYLDNTIRTPEDVERVLGLPVLSFIAEMQSSTDRQEYLYVARQPRSPVSEAFRSLRVNLEYAGVDKPLRTILVTSPAPGEGKTTIATNLAAIIAQSGKTALLLDADMRRPQVHKMLGIDNRIGLSDLFRAEANHLTVQNNWNGNKELSVITSGSLPPNPSELLSSERMGTILQELSEAADVVVIDSPPTLVTDAQILAHKVDGVILVIHPGQTRAESALAAREQFERVGGRLLGVVFNRIPRNRNHYYGSYRYNSAYYYSKGYSNYSPKESSLENSLPSIKDHKQARGSILGKMFAGRSKAEKTSADE